jgi:uncharacterized protein YkwD
VRRLVLVVLALTGLPVASASAVDCLVVLDCPASETPMTTEASDPQPTTTTTLAPEPVDATAVLVDLANRDRAVVGLAPLAVDGGSNAIAGSWSGAMADRGALAHNDAWFTASNRARLGAKLLGENVAYAGTLADAHRTLMNSPHHRDNLLDARFTVVGMAAVERHGLWWVTQDFAQVPVAPAASPTPTPEPAPAAPSRDRSRPDVVVSGTENEVVDHTAVVRWVATVAQRSWASACSRIR